MLHVCFRRLPTTAQVVQHTGRPVQGQEQSNAGRGLLRPVLGMRGRSARTVRLSERFGLRGQAQGRDRGMRLPVEGGLLRRQDTSQ